MTRQTLRWIAACALANAVALSPIACDKPADGPAPAASSAVPVDPSLLAFLSRARAAHHRADLLENEDPKLASSVLDELVEGPLPEGGAARPEVGEVLADTLARLADLRSRNGEYDAASRHIDRGLELARAVSYFRGHLFEMRGLVAERLAEAKKREAEQLLGTADERMTSAQRVRLESLLAEVATLRKRVDEDPSHGSHPELAEAERTLAELRISALSPELRARHRSLARERQAAISRALNAFEASMQIQAQVIEARTRSASRPAAESSAAPTR